MTELRTYDQMPGDDGTYSDAACAGAVFNTVEAAYKGSRYVATKGVQLSDAGGKHYVDQGVVAFGNGADARKFFATSQDSWRRCVGKHVTYNAKNDNPSTWTIRAPVTTGGITAAVVDEQGRRIRLRAWDHRQIQRGDRRLGLQLRHGGAGRHRREHHHQRRCRQVPGMTGWQTGKSWPRSRNKLVLSYSSAPYRSQRRLG
jgi:hypothetical protein